MSLKFSVATLYAILTTGMCCGGDAAITFSDISEYYSDELSGMLVERVTKEVHSNSFRDSLRKAVGLRERAPFDLSFELKIMTDDGIGMMSLNASISGMPTTIAGNALDVVERYIRCRVRGCSESYSLLVALPSRVVAVSKQLDAVRNILKAYPLAAPELLQLDSVREDSGESVESYVIKDVHFWWYYDVRRSRDGTVKQVNERRVNTLKQYGLPIKN